MEGDQVQYNKKIFLVWSLYSSTSGRITVLILHQVSNDSSIEQLRSVCAAGVREKTDGSGDWEVTEFGIQMGNLGSGSMDVINEFSIKALFGVTLNDQWFLKFKYR